MDINPHEMDKLFRKAAEGFRPEAPESSWLEIEKRIRRKKKKGFAFWLSVASLFFIVGGTGAWMGLSSTSTSPTTSLVQQPSSTTVQKHISTVTSTNPTESSSLNSTSRSPDLFSTKPITAPTSTTLTEVEKSTIKNQKLGTVTNSLSKSTSKTAGRYNNAHSATLAESSLSISKPAKKNRTVRRFQTAISGRFTPPQVLEEDFSKILQDQVSNHEMQQKPLVFASLPTKTPQLHLAWNSNPMKLIFDEDPIFNEKPKKNLFEQMPGPSWAVVFQPEYVNNSELLRSNYLVNQNGTVVSVPVNSNFRSSLNSLNHNIGFSLALQSRFALDFKNSLDVGLSYGFRNDRQNYFECFNPNSGESKLYYQPIHGWKSNPQTYVNSYHYLSLPIGMTHALSGNLKSKGIRVHWNITPHYLVAGKSMTFQFFEDQFSISSIAENSVYRKIGCSGGIGMGYAVKLNSRSLLETGIQWNGNWSTLFNGYYPVDKRFGAIGARIGFVFK
jgi:hypothetical protein